MTAGDLATEFDLHVTTMRFHLDVLQRAGLVVGTPARAGRGRPAIGFRAALDDDAVAAQMVAVLADALADRDSRDRPRAAGRRWADRLPEPPAAPHPALVEGLGRLGFAPQEAPDGVIRLGACPFGEAATQNPDVVCRIHLGLAEGIVRRATGGRAHDRSVDLVPFAQPGVCELTVRADAATRESA